MIFKSKFGAIKGDRDVILFNNDEDVKDDATFEDVTVFFKENSNLILEGHHYKSEKLTNRRYYCDNPKDMADLKKIFYLNYYFKQKKEFFGERRYYQAKSFLVGCMVSIDETIPYKVVLKDYTFKYVGQQMI